MYQIIDGETIEVIRWGDELLPINHPLATEVIGQLVLELEYED